MAITVLPCIRLSSWSWIAASTSLSSALRRFVQDQDRRVLQQHARDGDALALAARQLHAALADMGVVALAALAVLEAEDESCACAFARRDASLPRVGVGPAVEDVVA